MSREWAATGVGTYVPVEIDKDTRRQVTLQLRTVTTDLPALDQFFDVLGESVSRFRAHRNLADRSNPKIVRANIKKALKEVLRLNDSLNSLDGNSWQLIREQVEGGLTVQTHHLQTIIYALTQAEQAAREYPNTGRLRDHARLFLAVDVADAMHTHLGLTPTSTKDGPFDAILAIVLGAATGKRVSSTHVLVRRALDARKGRTHPGAI